MKIDALVAASALFALASFSTPARAELVASDSFVCPPSSLQGHDGGLGWAGSWQTDAGSAKALLLGPAIEPNATKLEVLGGALHVEHGDVRIYRKLDLGATSRAAKAGLVESAKTFFGSNEDALGRAGTTVWIAFLTRGAASAGGAGAEKIAQMHLYHGVDPKRFSLGNENKDGESIAIGRGNMNTDWNYESTCKHALCGKGGKQGGFIAKGAPFNDDKTHWVVLKFVFQADTTTTTFWLDPAPGDVEPAEATATPLTAGDKTQTSWDIPSFHFNWVELGGGAGAIADFDEVRVATAFTDVSHGASTIACGANVEAPPPQAPPGTSPSVGTEDEGAKGPLHSLKHLRKRYLAAIALVAGLGVLALLRSLRKGGKGGKES